MRKHLSVVVLAGLAALAGLTSELPAEQDKAEKKIRVVIIDGQNNHQWQMTTPLLKKILEDSGRFTVDVCTSNKPDSKKPADWEERMKPVPFPPELDKSSVHFGYDVVLSNYNGAGWPADFNKALDERLKEGKIGLVIVHAANNSFEKWNEYNQMIGMGWRGNKGGDRLYMDDGGKEVRVATGQGDGAGHRFTGQFTVIVRDAEHPITKGMPREWLHDKDELYDNMRGPIQNVRLLATAYSKGTKVHEPMIWTVSYGKGRVFHTPMGHDVTGMRCLGFVGTLLRGTEWAATDKVTLPLPANFPTADKSTSLPK